MDGWTDEWKDGQIDGQTDRTGRRTDGSLKRRAKGMVAIVARSDRIQVIFKFFFSIQSIDRLNENQLFLTRMKMKNLTSFNVEVIPLPCQFNKTNWRPGKVYKL